MPRYFFVTPDVDRPVGGINVSLMIVDVLSKAGYEAATLYSRRDYIYPFFETKQMAFFHPRLADVSRVSIRQNAKLWDWCKNLILPWKACPNLVLDVRPDDVFILPEFWYPEYSAVFPKNRRILLAQGFMVFCRALHRDLATSPRVINGFDAIVTTSDATQTAVKAFCTHPVYNIPLAVSRPTLNATTPKKRQIAYMPRKRGSEINVLLGCLKGNAAFDGWEFVAIDRVSQKEVDRILSESVIFLSYSHQEGFGLPPAEAMAAGCIVIGYTGVGGDEFFHSKVGMPIQDGDIAGFAMTLEATVTEYGQDPTRLDLMRKTASEEIHGKYNSEAMQASLLSAWALIEEKMAQ